MKDFAKSVRTGNADLGLRPVVPQLVKDIAKIYEDNGKDREKTKQELIQKHHMSERQAEDVLRQIVGNSKVGNLDPRISSIKSKLQNLAKQGDEGGIKDVEKFVEDMIKEINKRKDDLYAEINRAEENRQGWLDLRGDVMSARYEATHMKK